MIDYIKLSSRLNTTQMADLKNRIDFNGSYNESTGEPEKILANGKKVSYRSTAWIKNIKLELFPKGYIELAGSLHKYYNDGKHNYNQFGRKEAETALKQLIEVTGLELPYFKVESVEVGVNLMPPIPSDDGIIKLYLDGELVGSLDTDIESLLTDIPDSDNKFKIGVRDLYSSGYTYGWFKGKIDDIGIWNRVLSDCEVKWLYNN